MLIGILGLLIQLGIMVGIVVVIVRLVSKRSATTTESVGVLIRRFFVYAIMLTMLILVGIGVAGLINAALPASGEIVDSTSQAAISIAFVIVALPVYFGLSRYTARKLREDPHEQQSFGWAFYLVVALIGSLIAAMSLIGGVLSSLANGDGIDTPLVVHAVVWSVIWAGHWWVAQRWPSEHGTQVHLLAGSAVGLIWSFTGAIATASAVLSTIYDELFYTSIVGADLGDLARPAMILVVGLPVWWWYWIPHAKDTRRTPLWHAYVLLLGVLGGAVSVIVGAGIGLFGLLQWFIGDASNSAAAQFGFLPGALAAIIVGGVVWTYHANVLGTREERVRSEVDRVYDYILAGAGLLVAAGGIATLISTALKGLSGRAITTSGSGDAIAIAVTLLLIGVPLWWRYWSTIQRYRSASPADELGSISRRIYIVTLFGVAAVVAVVNLIVIVFVFFEDILEGALGAQTLDSNAISISLLLTAGALAWYHFAVFREDREVDLPEQAETVAEPEPAGDGAIQPGSLEHVLAELSAAGQTRVIVTSTDKGFEIERVGG